MAGKVTYIAESPLLLGVRWLRMELSLSVAMIDVRKSRVLANTGMNVEERNKM